uniref:Uncharacterized protein n=1 Tax=Myotis myotis TaxID=51298 RepID=A0A7J7SS27_MYOMY|nr:hypothetical protein mMyoMyo1_009282 [Myotis myotis]
MVLQGAGLRGLWRLLSHLASHILHSPAFSAPRVGEATEKWQWSPPVPQPPPAATPFPLPHHRSATLSGSLRSGRSHHCPLSLVLVPVPSLGRLSDKGHQPCWEQRPAFCQVLSPLAPPSAPKGQGFKVTSVTFMSPNPNPGEKAPPVFYLFIHSFIHSFIHYLLLISERKGEGERNRNNNDERESLIGPSANPPLETEPTTWACALTGNGTMTA